MCPSAKTTRSSSQRARDKGGSGCETRLGTGFANSGSMFIGDVVQGGAIPALEAMVHFSGARQRVINHNIANLTTPGFEPVDAEPGLFQRALGRALDERRRQAGGAEEMGPLELESTEQVDFEGGGMRLRPVPQGSGLGGGAGSGSGANKRDLERHMQDLSENMAMFRLAGDLFRSRVSMMREVLADRI